MPESLDIHAASPDEVVAAHHNVYDMWNRGLSLSDHVQFRLTSPAHRRASWFVGCLGGQVVSSLGCHPFQFRVRDAIVSGVGIASVYTKAEYRGRGFASKLLDWVHHNQHARGTGLSILFSDIDPDFYARLGYAVCPAFEGWYRPEASRAAPSSERHPYRLVRFLGSDGLSELARLYDDSERTAPWEIIRDEVYWKVLLAKFPNDEYFWLESPSKDRVGYVCLSPRDGEERIMDHAVAGDDEALVEALFDSLVARAHAQSKAVGGWLPDRPAAHHVFDLTARRAAIPMIRPITWTGTLDREVLDAAGRCREINHV